jgi:hypothetical protein
MLIVACVAEPTKVLAYEDVAHALERHDLPETQLRALYEALSAIVTRERSSGPARRPSPARTSTASSA